MSGELLAIFWQTVREYVPVKDRQTAADHIVEELVEMGISDADLHELAIDRVMQNAIREHVEIDEFDDEDE
jgi:hypothetical protein